MNIHNGIVLILEDEKNKFHHYFYSTDAVEDFFNYNRFKTL